MQVIQFLSIIIMPIFIAGIVAYGLMQRVPVFTAFTDGAKEGMSAMVSILPSLIGLFVAVSMFRASGAVELLAGALRYVLDLIGFPAEVLPLALLRPVSGSGSLAVVQDILNTYGADSLPGKIASVMMGSTDTTFYTLAIYYGSVAIKNPSYTVKAALVADCAGILSSVYIVQLLL